MRYGFLAPAAVLAVIWVIAFLIFHVVSAIVHILLILALLCFVVHLFRARIALRTYLRRNAQIRYSETVLDIEREYAR